MPGRNARRSRGFATEIRVAVSDGGDTAEGLDATHLRLVEVDNAPLDTPH